MEPKIVWVPLQSWNKHFVYPTNGTMRNLAAKRHENGADSFIRMVNEKFFINVDLFNKWMLAQDKMRSRKSDGT